MTLSARWALRRRIAAALAQSPSMLLSSSCSFAFISSAIPSSCSFIMPYRHSHSTGSSPRLSLSIIASRRARSFILSSWAAALFAVSMEFSASKALSHSSVSSFTSAALSMLGSSATSAIVSGVTL